MRRGHTRERRPPRMGSIAAACCLIAGALPLPAQQSDAVDGEVSAVEEGPATRQGIVDFQPGVRIDWETREVLVAGEVVLRQGALELFACSPNTREHESIVRVDARPLHIYQAMGLIGLEPGEPSYYDENDRYHPAHGAPVAMEVHYAWKGRDHQHRIETWMLNAETDEPIPSQPWVFAGSFVTDGIFAGDPEGTVVAVVDFPSAIVALPRFHSAGNEALWLTPNTEAVPEVGTEVTLMFRAGELVIRVDRRGRTLLMDQPATLAEIVARLKDRNPDAPLHPLRFEVHPEAPKSRREMVRRALGLIDPGISMVDAIAMDEGKTAPHDPAALWVWVSTALAKKDDSDGSPLDVEAWQRLLSVEQEIRWTQTTIRLIHSAGQELLKRFQPASASPNATGTQPAPAMQPTTGTSTTSPP